MRWRRLPGGSITTRPIGPSSISRNTVRAETALAVAGRPSRISTRSPSTPLADRLAPQRLADEEVGERQRDEEDLRLRPTPSANTIAGAPATRPSRGARARAGSRAPCGSRAAEGTGPTGRAAGRRRRAGAVLRTSYPSCRPTDRRDGQKLEPLVVGPATRPVELLARGLLALAVAGGGDAEAQREVEQHHHERDADQRDPRALVVLALADDQEDDARRRDRGRDADADEPQDHGRRAARMASLAPASSVLVKPALMSVKPRSR